MKGEKNMKNKIYTVTQAVSDALNSMPYDTKWHCYELFSKVRSNLISNNNPSRPYDGTIQRIMRSMRHAYGVVCLDRNKSIYMKKSDV